MRTCVVQETSDGNRWVRFGKRTHRRGVAPSANTRRVSSDSVWKTNPILGGLGLGELAPQVGLEPPNPQFSAILNVIFIENRGYMLLFSRLCYRECLAVNGDGTSDLVGARVG